MLEIGKKLSLIFLLQILIGDIGFSHHSDANSDCKSPGTINYKKSLADTKKLSDLNDKEIPSTPNEDNGPSHSCYFHCSVTAVFHNSELKIEIAQNEIKNNILFKNLMYKSLYISPEIEPPIFS